MNQLKNRQFSKGQYVLGAYGLVVIAGGLYNGMKKGNQRLENKYYNDIESVISSTLTGMCEGIAITAFSPFVIPIYAYNKFKNMKKE